MASGRSHKPLRLADAAVSAGCHRVTLQAAQSIRLSCAIPCDAPPGTSWPRRLLPERVSISPGRERAHELPQSLNLTCASCQCSLKPMRSPCAPRPRSNAQIMLPLARNTVRAHSDSPLRSCTSQTSSRLARLSTSAPSRSSHPLSAARAIMAASSARRESESAVKGRALPLPVALKTAAQSGSWPHRERVD